MNAREFQLESLFENSEELFRIDIIISHIKGIQQLNNILQLREHINVCNIIPMSSPNMIIVLTHTKFIIHCLQIISINLDLMVIGGSSTYLHHDFFKTFFINCPYSRRVLNTVNLILIETTPCSQWLLLLIHFFEHFFKVENYHVEKYWHFIFYDFYSFLIHFDYLGITRS